MCSREYNGWANYETWNIALWIGEVDGLGDMIHEQAMLEVKDAFDDIEDEFDKYTATWSLSKYLEELCHEMFDHGTEDLHGPIADAIGSYYAQVVWYDIAENYIEEAARESNINPAAIIV
jgi:hypothetical protein